MTAGIAEDLDLDLSWADLDNLAGEAGCCDRNSCVPLEAVALAYWDRHCSCPDSRNPEKLCAPHRDRTLRLDREPGDFECIGCGTVVRLLKVEPVR